MTPPGAPPLVLLPVGRYGLLAETEGVAASQALYAAITARRATGELADLVDLVPAARSVLALARPSPAGAACLRRLTEQLRDWSPQQTAPVEPHGRVVELGVRYDGPDLADTAELLGLGIAELVRQHVAVEYTVAFCGFAPGFGYLPGLPAALQVPRLATPRTRVPAGAVGLADEFCGVYPRSSPGGWRLIGQTDAVLWDTAREPAALLAPGTRVRFREVAR